MNRRLFIHDDSPNYRFSGSRRRRTGRSKGVVRERLAQFILCDRVVRRNDLASPGSCEDVKAVSRMKVRTQKYIYTRE